MVNRPMPLPESLADYLRRYRLITPAILAARRLEDCGDEQEAAELLERLASLGLLASASLLPGDSDRSYYYASGRAAKQLCDPGLGEVHRTLEERLAYWAIASFCSSEGLCRELLTRDEFRERFPQLWKAGEPNRYYLEQVDGVARLAFLKVDLGATPAGTGSSTPAAASSASGSSERRPSRRAPAEHSFGNSSSTAASKSLCWSPRRRKPRRSRLA